MNTKAVSNPFGNNGKENSAGSMVAIEQERAVQEVQASLVIAKRFPRNHIEAMDRILQTCTRESLANSALYSYSRGGSEITGPSIRLAEALAQNWGNIQFGVRELEQRAGLSVVEAFAWDVETNTRQVKTFSVPHVRDTRNGKKIITDARDVYEIVANQGARRLRACILGVIPGDVTEAAVRQCELTQQSSVDTSPENIKKLLSTFLTEFGVTQGQIEKRIQRRMESIRPAQFLQLRNIYQSLKDGMSSTDDWFEPVSGASLAEIISPQETNVKETIPENSVVETKEITQESTRNTDQMIDKMADDYRERIGSANNLDAVSSLRKALDTDKSFLGISLFTEIKNKAVARYNFIDHGNRVEVAINALPNPGTTEASALFAKAEAILTAAKRHIGDELYEGFRITLDDMKPEYVS